MAGHSKWKQIKHKKATADAKRGVVFGKMARAITAAVQSVNGDTDSPTVQAVVDRARSIDMPKENIERALQKGSGHGGPPLENLLFELFAPGGVACIIIASTDSRNRTVQEIKHLVSEYDCTLGLSGSAVWAFEKNSDGTYRPLAEQAVDGDDEEALTALLSELYSHGDIEAIYTNSKFNV